MSSLSSLYTIPDEYERLKNFGVGSFSREEQLKKAQYVHELMNRRRSLSSEPFLSVVVPAYRETKCLLATLRSLAQQKFSDVEFLIVSNGEPVGNATQRLAESAGFTVVHERRGGVGRARQVGLLAAKGRIVVSTDADTLHHPQWLSRIVDHWMTTPSLLAGFGRVYALSNSTFTTMCSEFQNLTRYVLSSQYLAEHYGLISETNCWFLRDAALQVGGYDVHANYAEGTMLFRKIATFGNIIPVHDTPTAVYTSDRRQVYERFLAVTQYLLNPDRLEYAPVR